MSTKLKFKNIVVERINQIISSDIVGPIVAGRGGVKYIMTCVDVFSKYIQFYAIKNCKTDTIINKLFKRFIPENGNIEAIQNDHASYYISEKWTETLKKH